MSRLPKPTWAMAQPLHRCRAGSWEEEGGKKNTSSPAAIRTGNYTGSLSAALPGRQPVPTDRDDEDDKRCWNGSLSSGTCPALHSHLGAELQHEPGW